MLPEIFVQISILLSLLLHVVNVIQDILTVVDRTTRFSIPWRNKKGPYIWIHRAAPRFGMPCLYQIPIIGNYNLCLMCWEQTFLAAHAIIIYFIINFTIMRPQNGSCMDDGRDSQGLALSAVCCILPSWPLWSLSTLPECLSPVKIVTTLHSCRQKGWITRWEYREVYLKGRLQMKDVEVGQSMGLLSMASV
jgi:hypothetical protein